MKKYKPINGFTKQKIIDTIKAKIKGRPSYKTDKNTNRGTCLYEDYEGNRCAIGAFIPDGHEALSFIGGVDRLLSSDWYPDLYDYMPLETDALEGLQGVHDMCTPNNNKGKEINPVPKLIEWIEKYVKD